MNDRSTSSPSSRRHFLRAAAATAGALAFPAIIPSRVLGAGAPGNIVTLGCVGVGGMGGAHVQKLLGSLRDRVRIVAVCDVDKFHRERYAALINQVQGGNGCLVTGDFREVTRREGIDAVLVATPDHWHTIPALDAIRNGKDVYIEKPLTLTIQEGQVLVAELRKHNRVGQTGTMQRSDLRFQTAAEVIRSGALGEIERIEVLIPANNMYAGATWQPEPVPEGLDYDFWIGPAPWAPYTKQRTHYQFRYILDYAGGQTTNWGAHYIDIAQWALGMDESGPVAVEGFGEFPTSGLFTAPTRVEFTARYANGVPMRVRTRTDGVYDGNIVFRGKNGWLDVSRGKLKASDPGLVQDKGGPDSVVEHWKDFCDCIATRQRPRADLAIGHRTTTVCNLGNIAMQLRRPLKWDPATEQFQDDVQATRMLGRSMRGPWSLA